MDGCILVSNVQIKIQKFTKSICMYMQLFHIFISIYEYIFLQTFLSKTLKFPNFCCISLFQLTLKTHIISIYPSMLLSIYPSMNLSTYQSITLSTYPSMKLSIYSQGIYLSAYPSIILSAYPSIILSAYPFMNLSIYPSMN